MALVGQQWACTSCTFLNEPSANVCEICGSTSPALLLSGEGEWACVGCTFVNEGTDGVCAMCNIPRGGTKSGDLRTMCETCRVAPANVPFASCCRACALNQACNCSATTPIQSSAPPKSKPGGSPRKRQANSSRSNDSKKGAASSPTAASTTAASSTMEIDTSIGPSSDSLSTAEAFALLSECGALAAKASTEAQLLTTDLERVLDRLFRHVVRRHFFPFHSSLMLWFHAYPREEDSDTKYQDLR